MQTRGRTKGQRRRRKGRAWWLSDYLRKKAIKARIFKVQRGLCAVCEIRMLLNIQGQPNSAELDHVKAQSREGEDCEENYQLLCRLCNEKKGAKAMDVFAYRRERELSPGELVIRR
jgi:5-methylcytosine-specific restriction endonuclease McrA